jgi:hypothetical protein
MSTWLGCGVCTIAVCSHCCLQTDPDFLMWLGAGAGLVCAKCADAIVADAEASAATGRTKEG